MIRRLASCMRAAKVIGFRFRHDGARAPEGGPQHFGVCEVTQVPWGGFRNPIGWRVSAQSGDGEVRGGGCLRGAGVIDAVELVVVLVSCRCAAYTGSVDTAMKDDSSPQSPLMAALEKFEAAESNFLKLERLWSEIEGLKSQFLVRIAYDQDEKSRKKFDEGLKELQTHAVWRSQSDRLQLAPRRLESGKCLFSTLRCVRHIKRRVAWRRSSWDTGNDKDKPVKVLASSQKGRPSSYSSRRRSQPRQRFFPEET